MMRNDSIYKITKSLKLANLIIAYSELCVYTNYQCHKSFVVSLYYISPHPLSSLYNPLPSLCTPGVNNSALNINTAGTTANASTVPLLPLLL
jgi:hypothetical protein